MTTPTSPAEAPHASPDTALAPTAHGPQGDPRPAVRVPLTTYTAMMDAAEHAVNTDVAMRAWREAARLMYATLRRIAEEAQR